MYSFAPYINEIKQAYEKSKSKTRNSLKISRGNDSNFDKLDRKNSIKMRSDISIKPWTLVIKITIKALTNIIGL